MKLDSETVHDHLTWAHKHKIVSVDDMDNSVKTEGLKADNEIVREDKHGIISDLKIQNQNYEMCTEPLNSEKHDGDGAENAPGLHDFMDVEDSVNSREYEAGDSVTSCIIPASELNLNEKETNFYTDKSVMECELSKFIVCFKEGTYHFVKDICIDERVHSSLEKISLKHGQVDHKGLNSIPHSDLEANSDFSKVKVDTLSPNSDGMEILVEGDCNKDFVSKIAMQKGEIEIVAGDKIANEISNEKAVPGNMLSVQELDAKNSDLVATKFDGNEGHQHSDQDSSIDALSANSMVSSVAEESGNVNHDNKILFSSKVENGSITFDFDSSTPVRSRKEGPPNVDCQQSLQTINILELEDHLDSRTASCRSFYVQHGHGESSFSTADPFSGPIAYSGPIPYSGNISFRSESSTTSTRSFAFPKLYSEWKSSPVKMAKADRRQFRKHRGWMIGLLCCKF